MSYFFSPQAEFKAKRITQMLAPITAIAATRDGTIMANWQGHVHMFTLDENKQLQLVDSVDFVRNQNPPTVILHEG